MIPIALNEMKLLKVCKKNKFYCSRNLIQYFFKLYEKAEKFFKTPNEMTSRRNVKKNLYKKNDLKDTIHFLTVIANMFDKKMLNLQPLLKVYPCTSLMTAFKKSDENDKIISAYPTNLTEVFITVRNSK